MEVEGLPLRADEARVEERQAVAADLHEVAGAAEAGDDVGRVDGLDGLTADADPNAQQAVGRRALERAVVGDAVGEELGRRNLERDRRDVVAGEDVLDRRLARALEAAEVAGAEVDEVEDALLVELIGIIEVAGDDARAVRQRGDEGVDEGLVVQPLFAARL